MCFCKLNASSQGYSEGQQQLQSSSLLTREILFTPKREMTQRKHRHTQLPTPPSSTRTAAAAAAACVCAWHAQAAAAAAICLMRAIAS
jgi:hypothetical protein